MPAYAMDVEVYLEEKRRVVDQRLSTLLNELRSPDILKLNDSIEYAVLRGGKRFRPIMTLATYELFKKDWVDVLDAACAMELIHSASLILDDLPCMDNAEYRRNKPATHRVFGEAVGVLASATLFTLSFEIFSKINRIKINSIIRETSQTIGPKGMIQGQFIDVESFQKPSTIEQLNDCYYLKTGILFCNAVKVGALLGGATEEQLQQLEVFAKHFGLAYQIRDDILDVVASKETIGKDVGLDEQNKKPTYPSLVGLEASHQQIHKEIDCAINALVPFGDNAGTLIAITEQLARIPIGEKWQT